MYATYEDPFSVQLTEEPRYVHVQAQDAAGNVEDHVTVELPTLAGNTLDLEPTVASRCVAGKVYLYVSVRNADDVPLVSLGAVRCPWWQRPFTRSPHMRVAGLRGVVSAGRGRMRPAPRAPAR